MKKIKADAEEHNRRVIEKKEELEGRKKLETKLLHLYAKGLSSDVDVLWSEVSVFKRDAGVRLWEMGRRLIVLRARTPQGEFKSELEKRSIPRSTAYKAIDAVMNIPDADLKALSRNPSHAYELGGALTEEQEALAEQIESGKFSPSVVARRSPADVKKMLSKIEKLEEKLAAAEEKGEALQAEVDALKLGTIDERALEKKLGEWQWDFDRGIMWLLSLSSDISQKSQMDIYQGIRWMVQRLLQAEVYLSERFPKYDSYSGPDRGMMLNWLEERSAGKSFVFSEEDQAKIRTGTERHG